MRAAHTNLHLKQLLSLLLGVSLGLAIFISPYQLHHNPASIFFNTQTSVPTQLVPTEHATHSQHEQHQDSQAIRCLRCVLYGFQVPETLEPFSVFLIVLGFLTFIKPTQPFSFITFSKKARAPPVSL
jgi:hypothetical protein